MSCRRASPDCLNSPSSPPQVHILSPSLQGNLHFILKGAQLGRGATFDQHKNMQSTYVLNATTEEATFTLSTGFKHNGNHDECLNHDGHSFINVSLLDAYCVAWVPMIVLWLICYKGWNGSSSPVSLSIPASRPCPWVSLASGSLSGCTTCILDRSSCTYALFFFSGVYHEAYVQNGSDNPCLLSMQRHWSGKLIFKDLHCRHPKSWCPVVPPSPTSMGSVLLTWSVTSERVTSSFSLGEISMTILRGTFREYEFNLYLLLETAGKRWKLLSLCWDKLTCCTHVAT